jgi:hypothetical protein
MLVLLSFKYLTPGGHHSMLSGLAPAEVGPLPLGPQEIYLLIIHTYFN